MLLALMPLACAPRFRRTMSNKTSVPQGVVALLASLYTNADQASHALLALPETTQLRSPLHSLSVQTSVLRNAAADLSASPSWQPIHSLSARRVVRIDLSARRGTILTLITSTLR